VTHEERLALIHRPFFITYMGCSYPWGGTAVKDNFFGTESWAERPTPHGDSGGDGALSMFVYGPVGLRNGEIVKMGW
jgi:hypothetical protein